MGGGEAAAATLAGTVVRLTFPVCATPLPSRSTRSRVTRGFTRVSSKVVKIANESIFSDKFDPKGAKFWMAYFDIFLH